MLAAMTKRTVLLLALCSFSLEHGEFLLRHDPKNDAVEEQVEIWTDFDFLSEFGSSKTVVDNTEFSVFFGVPAVKIEFRKLERLPHGEIGCITFFKLLKGSVTLSLGNMLMNRDRVCQISKSDALDALGFVRYCGQGSNVSLMFQTSGCILRGSWFNYCKFGCDFSNIFLLSALYSLNNHLHDEVHKKSYVW
uniref:Uncharacterized protein n=1 Tax=Cucumis melo TaxID=3656 RepID=A0A9I9EHI8_CUCME